MSTLSLQTCAQHGANQAMRQTLPQIKFADATHDIKPYPLQQTPPAVQSRFSSHNDSSRIRLQEVDRVEISTSMRQAITDLTWKRPGM